LTLENVLIHVVVVVAVNVRGVVSVLSPNKELLPALVPTL
jgi:hypothetical protein